MKSPKRLLLIACFALCLTSKAFAGEGDRKQTLTFGEPVAIPGIVLPAGTYVFDFLGSTADRNIIDVLSPDGQKVYTTLEALPDYRSDATGETGLVFEDGKAGEPHAIKEWFFPDRRYGHLFVYPGTGTPLELGRSDEGQGIKDVEPSEIQSTDAPWTEKNAETAAHAGQTTQPEESDYWRALHQKQADPSKLARTEEPESSNRPAESGDLSYGQALRLKQQEELRSEQVPTQSAMLRELPRTASHLPGFLFSGTLLLAAGVGLRLSRSAGR